MPALVVAPALADFPGAPFAESLVESAGESVRAEAGWHIAPEVTETLRVFSEGGTALVLPTLKYTVTAVRDTSGDTPEVLTGWTDRGSGILLKSYWPVGHMLEVDLVHGYEICPPELLPVIAHRVQASRSPGANVRLGSLSIGGDPGTPEQDDAVLARFTL